MHHLHCEYDKSVVTETSSAVAERSSVVAERSAVVAATSSVVTETSAVVAETSSLVAEPNLIACRNYSQVRKRKRCAIDVMSSRAMALRVISEPYSGCESQRCPQKRSTQFRLRTPTVCRVGVL